MWDDQFTPFAHHYRVIRYDVRGFGKSELPQVAYADTQDLHELLHALKVERIYLLGLSLGGAIAIDFMLEYPSMVDGLILVGASVSDAPIHQLYTEEQLKQRILQQEPLKEAMKACDIPALVEAMMNDPTLVPSPAYPEARQRVRQNLSEYSFVWLLDPAPRQKIDPPAWERLSTIHVPTLLVVGGDDDIVLHRIADKLEQDIPRARRVMIPGTHHMPNMEKPEEFNRIVLDFLGKL